MVAVSGKVVRMALEATMEMIEADHGVKTAVVTLAGMMTLGPNLRIADQQIQSAFEQGAKNLVLDHDAGVVFGFGRAWDAGAYVWIVQGAINGQFRLCGVGDRVMSMLRMTTTDRMLTIDVDRSASLAALGIDSITGEG